LEDKVTDYFVEKVPTNAVEDFIRKYHYSRSIRGLHISFCFGLFTPNGKFGIPTLIGSMMFGIPAMAGVAESYMPEEPKSVIELNRLCCIDGTPTNTESYFIGKAIRWIKQHTDYKLILSYADTKQGHDGVIYKATNFIHLGMTNLSRALIADGEVYHARMLTKKSPKFENIRQRIKKGDENIWTEELPAKHIYVLPLNNKIKKRVLKNI
jgi:hypothetical protein